MATRFFAPVIAAIERDADHLEQGLVSPESLQAAAEQAAKKIRDATDHICRTLFTEDN